MEKASLSIGWQMEQSASILDAKNQRIIFVMVNIHSCFYHSKAVAKQCVINTHTILIRWSTKVPFTLVWIKNASKTLKALKWHSHDALFYVWLLLFSLGVSICFACNHTSKILFSWYVRRNENHNYECRQQTMDRNL